MARIFITGSADGLGRLAAESLIAQGHEVVLHARNETRVQQAMKNNPKAAAVLTGDLSNIEETKALARKANEWGTFDAVIHNAGVYRVSAAEIFAVNTLAPYILTSLVHPPGRLIYLSSGMHLHGSPKLEKFTTDINRITYSDSKLHVVLLCKAVARLWRDIFANAVDPGWVPTKMGGRGAPDDLQKGYATQVWLATSEDAKAKVTGRYFFHQQERRYNTEADNEQTQDQFLAACAQVTGVFFPRRTQKII
jgi:NAD(P)-dependent dehydrogenase (short-subunit alcohol dehydrogenase family)